MGLALFCADLSIGTIVGMGTLALFVGAKQHPRMKE